MEVRLISYSQTTENLHVGKDVQELIAYCARVSNPSNQINEETSAKLLRYLAKHKHWSPFEMVSACLEIETTRDIARQMLRHRSFSFQEFSQRYADVDSLTTDNVLREPRLQDTKNRQNSIELDEVLDSDARVDILMEWYKLQSEVTLASRKAYTWALENGIAKEQARVVLPEGMTTSRLYVNGTLRSWIHYIELRSGNGTQKEHIELAKACAEAISKIFPNIMEYVNE